MSAGTMSYPVPRDAPAAAASGFAPSARSLALAAATLAAVAGAWWARSYSFVVFHCFAELICVVIAAATFVVAWNTRRYHASLWVLLLGVTLLSVGVLDLFHMLAYRGMAVFSGSDANTSPVLWIVSRYLMSLSLVAAALLVGVGSSPNGVANLVRSPLSAGLLAFYAAGDDAPSAGRLRVEAVPDLLRRGRRPDAVQEGQRVRHLRHPRHWRPAVLAAARAASTRRSSACCWPPSPSASPRSSASRSTRTSTACSTGSATCSSSAPTSCSTARSSSSARSGPTPCSSATSAAASGSCATPRRRPRRPTAPRTSSWPCSATSCATRSTRCWRTSRRCRRARICPATSARTCASCGGTWNWRHD